MIDTHVHFRDWDEKDKETLRHGIEVAYRAGLDGAFEQCNTKPALISRDMIEKRIEEADQVINVLGIDFFHGIHVGLTGDPKQIEEVYQAYLDYFPRVVGFKMIPGLIAEDKVGLAFQVLAGLGYTGVVTSHCERDLFIGDWDPNNPISHTTARPQIAEITGIRADIEAAKNAGYEGTLAIAHVSVPYSLSVLKEERGKIIFKLVSEATPHHSLLYDEMMNEPDGIVLKMNPPLRIKRDQEMMLKMVLKGAVDYIGTDHAPHEYSKKVGEPYSSGIPCLPVYPIFIKILREKGMSEEAIDKITHDNILSIFKIPPETITNTRRAGKQTEIELRALRKEYAIDLVKFLKTA